MPRYIRNPQANAIAKTRKMALEANKPTGTEKSRTREVAAQAGLDADFAKDLAQQLELELGPLPGQIQDALTAAAESLEEAGLARSEAAAAVAAAQQAATDATQAINDALAAANLARGANTWDTRAPLAADATGKPVGATWFQLGSNGYTIAMWSLQPLGWIQRDFDETIIPQIAIGSGTYGTLAGDRLVARSVTAAQIAAETITAAEIAAAAVTAIHLAAEAVTAEKIAAGAVATDKLDALAVTAEKLAAGAVLADKIAANAILAEHIAVGALDAMEIRGVQIYGGYIEAPVIASSSQLGSGANVLTDPGFASSVNTAWVLSGHSGDAATTQRDSYWWDQTYSWKQVYPPDTWVVMRNTGNSHVDLSLTPAVRQCGSLVFANYSWKPANRTLTDPFTFTNRPDWMQGYAGGAYDPSWGAPAAPTPLAGTAKTSYLTNSAVIAVAAGERWNVRLEFYRLMTNNVDLVDLTLEVINSANSAVLWSRPLLEDEKLAGRVNDWWDSTFTGNVKYRIKSVYTAGGGSAARKPVTSGVAVQYRAGVPVSNANWSAAPDDFLPYGQGVGKIGTLGYTPGAQEISRRAIFKVVATKAMFAKVTPQAGWRLSTDNGFELFDSLGAQTGRLNGQSNFLTGTFSTKESGSRAEMSDAQFKVTNFAGDMIGQFYSDGTKSVVSVREVFANARRVYGDETPTLASIITLVSGTTIHDSSWLRRREDGYVYGTLAFYRSSGFTSGTPFASLNTGWRPVGGDQLPAVMWGAGSPGRAHFQIGGVANGALIVWSPPANTQYVSAKVSFMT